MPRTKRDWAQWMAIAVAIAMSGGALLSRLHANDAVHDALIPRLEQRMDRMEAKIDQLLLRNNP